jgi:hypothetical protein
VREKEQQTEAYKIKDFLVEETYEEKFKPVALPNLSLYAHLNSNWQYNLRKSTVTEIKLTSDFLRKISNMLE